jgi:predicted small secreted protein
MKLLMILVLCMVSGCATVTGALEGAGKDLSRAGEYVSSKVKGDKVKYEDQ